MGKDTLEQTKTPSTSRKISNSTAASVISHSSLRSHSSQRSARTETSLTSLVSQRSAKTATSLASAYKRAQDPKPASLASLLKPVHQFNADHAASLANPPDSSNRHTKKQTTNPAHTSARSTHSTRHFNPVVENLSTSLAGSRISSESPKTPPPPYEKLSFTPINPEDAAEDLNFYFQLFSTKATEKLISMGEPNDWLQKKRTGYQIAIGNRLEENVRKQRELATTSLSQAILNGKAPTISSLIGTVGGVGITACFGADLSLGLFATGITATTLFGYFVYNVIAVKYQKGIAKKLIPFLPEENSPIINLIATIAALYAANVIDTELKVKFSVKLLFDPVKLTELFKKIYSGESCETLLKDCDSQIKAVYSLAKKDAEKIFSNLKHYAKNESARRPVTQSTIFNCLFTETSFVFINEYRSATVVQRLNCFVAWSHALDQLISKSDALNQRTIYALLGSIKLGTDAEMQKLKLETINRLETEFEEGSMISAALKKPSSQVSDWVTVQNGTLKKDSTYASCLQKTSDSSTPIPMDTVRSSSGLMFFPPAPSQAKPIENKDTDHRYTPGYGTPV